MTRRIIDPHVLLCLDEALVHFHELEAGVVFEKVGEEDDGGVRYHDTMIKKAQKRGDSDAVKHWTQMKSHSQAYVSQKKKTAASAPTRAEPADSSALHKALLHTHKSTIDALTKAHAAGSASPAAAPAAAAPAAGKPAAPDQKAKTKAKVAQSRSFKGIAGQLATRIGHKARHGVVKLGGKAVEKGLGWAVGKKTANRLGRAATKQAFRGAAALGRGGAAAVKKGAEFGSKVSKAVAPHLSRAAQAATQLAKDHMPGSNNANKKALARDTANASKGVTKASPDAAASKPKYMDRAKAVANKAGSLLSKAARPVKGAIGAMKDRIKGAAQRVGAAGQAVQRTVSDKAQQMKAAVDQKGKSLAASFKPKVAKAISGLQKDSPGHVAAKAAAMASRKRKSALKAANSAIGLQPTFKTA